MNSPRQKEGWDEYHPVMLGTIIYASTASNFSLKWSLLVSCSGENKTNQETHTLSHAIFPWNRIIFFSLGNYGVTNFDCSSVLKHAQHHGLAPLYYLGKAPQGKTKCLVQSLLLSTGIKSVQQFVISISWSNYFLERIEIDLKKFQIMEQAKQERERRSINKR